MTATRKPRLLSVQPVSDGGGSEHALIGLIRELTGAGWECHVALPGPARLASDYAAAGARLHSVPMRRLTTTGRPARWLAYAVAWPVTVARLAVLGRRVGADVMHSNSLHAWHGWAAARLARRPHVWHAREIVFQSGAALRVERFLAAHFADRVIAVSGAVAAQLDPANVEVVLDRPDPGRFSPDRAGRFRAGCGIADDVPLVGFAGRFDTWKGVDLLLDAFAAVAGARPGTELVLAGSAVPGKEALAARLRARAEGLPGVHWVGWRDDVPDLMADLDVFVSVSTEPEPFGLVVVEALASGVPVVAGAEGGPLEVLGPEAAEHPTVRGRLVAPGVPEAAAGAILGLLPERTSAERRRGRSRLLPDGEPRSAQIFAEVVNQRKRSS